MVRWPMIRESVCDRMVIIQRGEEREANLSTVERWHVVCSFVSTKFYLAWRDWWVTVLRIKINFGRKIKIYKTYGILN